MNQEKIGKFIAQNRKKQNLTQENLAEKLGVSINAVSKWERGLNLPDVAIMLDLCSILSITLNELFAGEKINEKDFKEVAEQNLITVLKNSSSSLNKKVFKTIGITSLVVSVISTLIIIGLIIINEVNYKTIKVDDNELEISLCVTENNYIALSANHSDGKGMYYTVDNDITNDIVNVSYYRYYKEVLNTELIDYGTGIIFIENSHNNIYVNNKLVWSKNDSLKECDF